MVGIKDIFYLNSLRIWDKNGSVVMYLVILTVLQKCPVVLSMGVDTFPSETRAIQWPLFTVFVLPYDILGQVYVLIKKTSVH